MEGKLLRNSPFHLVIISFPCTSLYLTCIDRCIRSSPSLSLCNLVAKFLLHLASGSLLWHINSAVQLTQNQLHFVLGPYLITRSRKERTNGKSFSLCVYLHDHQIKAQQLLLVHCTWYIRRGQESVPPDAVSIDLHVEGDDDKSHKWMNFGEQCEWSFVEARW